MARADDAPTNAQVEQVRRFNRTVTQRVGALNDHYLARDRPLGEARVLWQIGESSWTAPARGDHAATAATRLVVDPPDTPATDPTTATADPAEPDGPSTNAVGPDDVGPTGAAGPLGAGGPSKDVVAADDVGPAGAVGSAGADGPPDHGGPAGSVDPAGVGSSGHVVAADHVGPLDAVGPTRVVAPSPTGTVGPVDSVGSAEAGGGGAADPVVATGPGGAADPVGPVDILGRTGVAEAGGPVGARRNGGDRGAWGDGCDVRQLRALLDLDSGYLSRLLRSLEADGLVTVEPSADDKRVRTARLTPAGRSERAVLDQRSDVLARSLLAPLSPHQRERLVTAMGEVERLLTAALVEVLPVDPAHRHAAHCLRAYYAEIDLRIAGGYDLDKSVNVALDEIRPPAGVFLVASLRGDPVGCGALRTPEPGVSEIRRMWVDPQARGLGVGRRLLTELESRARSAGSRTIRLDTNDALTEAITMYRSAGYEEVPAFNDDPHATLYFQKSL